MLCLEINALSRLRGTAVPTQGSFEFRFDSTSQPFGRNGEVSAP